MSNGIKVSYSKMDLKLKARTKVSLRMTFKESRLHDANFGVCFLQFRMAHLFLECCRETSALREVYHETWLWAAPLLEVKSLHLKEYDPRFNIFTTECHLSPEYMIFNGKYFNVICRISLLQDNFIEFKYIWTVFYHLLCVQFIVHMNKRI